MKNRLLEIIRNTIPYVKELRPYAGSVSACILMQQLDYWFAEYPNGFYKFMEPCGNKYYREKDSWQEELGMSADEFRTAFDKIGTRYTSKTAYDAAPDKFQDKYYCSYFDKKEGVTHYFRNHEKVDALIDELAKSPSKRPSTVDGKRHLQETANASYVNGTAHLQGWKTPDHIGTEIISENNQKNGAQSAKQTNTPSAADRQRAKELFGAMPPEQQQALLNQVRQRTAPDFWDRLEDVNSPISFDLWELVLNSV